MLNWGDENECVHKFNCTYLECENEGNCLTIGSSSHHVLFFSHPPRFYSIRNQFCD